MTKISYQIGQNDGSIYWAAAEHFGELEETTFRLGEMEAIQIEKLNNLSPTAKILLSAVAGAIIQHLIDQGVEPEKIFSTGTFKVAN